MGVRLITDLRINCYNLTYGMNLISLDKYLFRELFSVYLLKIMSVRLSYTRFNKFDNSVTYLSIEFYGLERKFVAIDEITI